ETTYVPPTDGQQPEAVTQEAPSEQKMFPYEYTEAELKARHAALNEKFPQFSKQDVHMLVLCEQMPNDTFLERTKQAKNGFATDSEQFYVRDLTSKTSLTPEIINFIVYYL